jgi:hypothetical protein
METGSTTSSWRAERQPRTTLQGGRAYLVYGNASAPASLISCRWEAPGWRSMARPAGMAERGLPGLPISTAMERRIS